MHPKVLSELTDAEKKLLLVVCDPRYYGLNNLKKCEVAGVGERTYYKAMKTPRFLEAMKYLSAHMLIGELSDVLKSLTEKAKEGSARHQKMFFQILGMFVDKKEVHTVTETRSIFAEMTNEELRATLLKALGADNVLDTSFKVEH